MKINPGDAVRHGLRSSVIKTPSESPSSTFAEVLQKTVKTNSPEKVATLPPTGAVIRPMLTASAHEVYRSTEQVLNTMEHYQHLLADTKADLRAVDPAIRRLKEEVSTLEPLMNQMPEENPIKPIAQQALMTAGKEIARFEGGEYIKE